MGITQDKNAYNTATNNKNTNIGYISRVILIHV